MKRRNKLYFYPIYFDSELTRNHGRRVNKKIAVKSPSLENMAKAAASLGYQFELEPTKAHPKCWWNKGRIAIVNPSDKKGRILVKLSKKMKKSKK
ncbi:MAG: signal recognition particle subunit SRP19/SEC65 family protein [Candidatus Helarchaeota archaeon]